MVSSYLEAARRETLESKRRTVAYLSRATGIGASFTGQGGAGTLDAESRKMAMNARDQISRYRDQVHTSVRPIARRIAGQPFRMAKIGKSAPGKRSAEPTVYARKECHDLLVRAFGIKGDADIEILDQHPILDRLNGNPSESMPWLTGQAMKQATVISTYTTGYSCWWMPKGKEVVYVPPHWIRPLTSPKGLFKSWALRPEGSQDDTIIPAEDMAYFVEIDPANPMKPLGPLEAGIRTVMVQEYVQEALKRAFQLGMHPGAIVHLAMGTDREGRPIKKRLKKWQIDQYRAAAEQRLRGPLNYGLWWFVDSLINKVEPFGHKPNEMDFGMNADKTQAAVEQTFGTSPYITGAKGANRAESAEAERHFVYSTVNPTIEMLSHPLTYSVAPRMGGEGFVLFIEPCRPHDSEMEFNYAKMADATGKLTVNEVRIKYLGLDPVPWGDAVWAPRGQALIPVDNLMGGYIPPVGAGGQAVPATATLPTDPQDATEDDTPPDEQDEQQAENEESDNEEAGKAHRPFDKAFYTGFAKAWLKLHGKQETTLSDALTPLFKKQRNAVVEKFTELYRDKTPAQLKRVGAKAIAKKIFRPAEWVEQLKDIARENLAKGMAAGAKHELAAFSEPEKAKADSFDFEFEFGREFPEDILSGISAGLDETLAQDYWDGITETQLDDLGRKLQEALDAGKALREVVGDVEDVFDGTMGKERAERIARTESTWSVSKGQQVAREHLHEEGIVDGREWAATHDMKTRDTHYRADGQSRGIREPFDIGGYKAMVPGDPALPAKERCFCRCAALSTTMHGERGLRLELSTCDHEMPVKAWPYQG